MQGLYPQMAAVSPTLQPLQIQPMVAQPQSFGIMAQAQAFGMSPMQMLPQEYAQQTSPNKAQVKKRQSMDSPKIKSALPRGASPAASGPDMSGVGIFFQVPENDQGVAYVQHIVPRSSADRCGVIQLGDELLAAGEVGQMPTNISGKGLLVLREKILGKQGTFVVLHFQRKNKGEIYDIELMRGSPEYIEMMNMSTGLKEKQQNDMVRIHELENQVSNLKQQVQAYAAQIQVSEDPRIGPLEDELRARMDDLRRFEDMILRAKDRTAEALRARDEAVEQLEMLKRNPGGARGWDSSEYRELQEERDLLKREISGVKSERDMVEMERNQLRAQMKEFKAAAEAEKQQLQAEVEKLKAKNSQNNEANLRSEVEDLKEQLRARNKRDQDISRRLNNGHNAIAQALKEQQLAAASALEVLPSVDLIHSSMMTTFQADLKSMLPLEAFSMPLEPQLRRSSMVVPMEKREEYA